MSDFPNREDVETPLGAVYVWATSATHIGARGTFTVNGVKIRTRLDLHYRDGIWQRGDKADWSATYHALMTNRADSSKEVSSSARGKIEDVLVPWLAEYAAGAGADLVNAAAVEHNRRAIESARQKIETLRAEVEAAEAELARLTQ